MAAIGALSISSFFCTSGEEDETAVFSQRAKLFRFDKATNQWKEKGIGDMKILKHTETGRLRILSKRDY